MKILRVIRSLDPAGGGPVEGLRTISLPLLRSGVSTTVVSLDQPSAPWFSNDFPFTSVGLGPVRGTYGYSRHLPERIQDLALQHDAVIVEGLWQYHSIATWRALRGTKIPYFVYTHGMLDPWFKRAHPLKHLKKCAYWPLEAKVIGDASAVLFTTVQEKMLARESFRPYAPNELVVGYGTSSPPIDSSDQRDSFFDRYPHLRDKRLFLFLGRIHPKKGVDLLIESFAVISRSFPDLHLVIAGPDQVGLQQALVKRVAVLGISHRVTWPGMLQGNQKWSLLRSAELFCLPSHQENFGVAVAEALSCCLPVSISSAVNISEDVAQAGAGIVHPDTLPGTIEALSKWLVLPPEVKQEMKLRCLKLFQQKYDSESVALNLISVLKKFA